jgi:hypothetical protein
MKLRLRRHQAELWIGGASGSAASGAPSSKGP